ncbi:MAG: hypothetical protein ACRDOM_09410, partial [Nocardioides sp.]
MSPQARMTLTRRTAWSTALAGTALLAGCDLAAEDEPAPPATSAGTGEPDADTGLVTSAVDEVAATLLLVVGIS